mmetsp:Transcript_2541/g.7602  ORF Transcript_2541/g.7602 Transcript_2541/m.7602 type:complete len:221 (-) Transcript_2541:2220-2882(-)
MLRAGNGGARPRYCRGGDAHRAPTRRGIYCHWWRHTQRVWWRQRRWGRRRHEAGSVRHLAVSGYAGVRVGFADVRVVAKFPLQSHVLHRTHLVHLRVRLLKLPCKLRHRYKDVLRSPRSPAGRQVLQQATTVLLHAPNRVVEVLPFVVHLVQPHLHRVGKLGASLAATELHLGFGRAAGGEEVVPPRQNPLDVDRRSLHQRWQVTAEVQHVGQLVLQYSN